MWQVHQLLLMLHYVRPVLATALCHHRHTKKPASALPDIAPMFRDYSWRGDNRKPGSVYADTQAVSNNMYKVSICNYFLEGRCPYGDRCTYAHSEAERRPAGPMAAGVRTGPSGVSAPRPAAVEAAAVAGGV